MPTKGEDTPMTDQLTARGRAELLAVRRESRSLYWMVAIFSFFVNLLMLTGPRKSMTVCLAAGALRH